VRSEGRAHLRAADVRRFRGLLRGHPELDDVEEELEQVLILRVAALHGEGEERSAVADRQRGRQVTRGRLPGSITL
jgi:hypothetical protein